MENFTPVAMRCTREQFDSIKPKLKENNLVKKHISSFVGFSYLVNNYMGNFISNLHAEDINLSRCEIYEEWDEKVFLEACGIKETFQITKEQLLELKSTLHKERVDYLLKEWFNKAFENALEVRKWYKWIGIENNIPINVLIYVTEFTENSFSRYGFVNGRWNDNYKTYTGKKHKEACINLKPATESEVFEAFKNEAVKRGFKENLFIHRPFWTDLNDCTIETDNSCVEWYYDSEKDYLEYCGYIIYSNGKWAEIIPTITKEEAEKLLNKKIV